MKTIENNTKDIIRRAVRTLNPKEIALGTCRSESDTATDDELRLYRKGAMAMLQNFADNEFVARVFDEFDKIYN